MNTILFLVSVMWLLFIIHVTIKAIRMLKSGEFSVSVAEEVKCPPHKWTRLENSDLFCTRCKRTFHDIMF